MKRIKLDLDAGKENIPPVNWQKCFLCQRETNEDVKCPLSTKRTVTSQAYSTVAKNIQEFSAIGELPLNVNLERLDDGSGLENTLWDNKAVYHKSCYLKFSSLKLERARKRKSTENNDDYVLDSIQTRSSSQQSGNPQCSEDHCFFCGEKDPLETSPTKGLRTVTTLELDQNVRRCAETLGDKGLLRKLAMGDMISLKAKYYAKCLASLYNKCRLSEGSHDNSAQNICESQAFAELISFMECYRDSENPHTFRLADLAVRYTNRMEQIGCMQPERVNTSRLKDKLLNCLPDLQAKKEGRDVFLMFDKGLGASMKSMYGENGDNDALAMMRAAQLVRREIFSNTYKFNGMFDENCKDNAVPKKLLLLINMILEGSSIDNQTLAPSSIASNSIAQLIVYNAVKHVRDKSSYTRHSIKQETPLPVYVGIKVHSQTKKKALIDTLHDAGLSIPYKRVMNISTAIANSVCALYEETDVVCPPKMCKSIFTTASVDNIDHNTSATSSNSSFHGTAISLMQHPDEKV